MKRPPSAGRLKVSLNMGEEQKQFTNSWIVDRGSSMEKTTMDHATETLTDKAQTSESNQENKKKQKNKKINKASSQQK